MVVLNSSYAYRVLGAVNCDHKGNFSTEKGMNLARLEKGTAVLLAL